MKLNYFEKEGNMMRTLFAVLLIFSLVSCEQMTFSDFIIENNSDSSIEIYGSYKDQQYELLESIGSRARKIIYETDFFGKSTDLMDPVSVLGSDLNIISEKGDTLQKDYKVLENWLSLVDEKRGTVNHTYTLVILESDFN